MPTYEYICKECGNEFDVFQRMNDPLLTSCPKCQKSALKRKIGSGAGIIFKGTGFYCTDYRKDSGSKGASEKAAENSSKTETKPAPAVSSSSSKE